METQGTDFRLLTLDMAAASLEQLRAIYLSLTGQITHGTEKSLREELLPNVLRKAAAERKEVAAALQEEKEDDDE